MQLLVSYLVTATISVLFYQRFHANFKVTNYPEPENADDWERFTSRFCDFRYRLDTTVFYNIYKVEGEGEINLSPRFKEGMLLRNM